MKKSKLLKGIVFGALGLAVGGILPAAQEPPPPAAPSGSKNVMVGKNFAIKIFDGGMEFNDKLVTGAPFSAQATTVTDQTLADGNHIHHQNNAALYRDSQGRTRRETTLEGLGPWSATEAESKPVVMINDPVAGVHYMLHPDEHTAMQMPLPKLQGTLPAKAAGGKAAAEDRVFAVRMPPPPPDAPGRDFHIFYQHFDREEQSGQTESLGTQVIQVVTERWYSTELQMVVMSKRSDPRVGETTFQLTNISRAEPAATLFQVPPDYTLEKAPPPNIVVRQSASESKP